MSLILLCEETPAAGCSRDAGALEAPAVPRRPRSARTIDGWTHRLSIQPGMVSEAVDWMDHVSAVGRRLFDVVEEHLKEDRPR
jgi:hypothetical protein